MTAAALTTMLILVVAVVAFVSGRIPTGLVAIGVSLALWATGILNLDQSFAGFSDPAVILIATLFVVAEGLDASGLTSWAGRVLVERGGGKPRVLTTLVILVVAILAALISVNGAVSALLPVVVVIASRSKIVPARLLIPLAFGAHAGALLTLTGSPVNVLLSEYAEQETGKPFGYFEFAWVGVPMLLGTVLISIFIANRLIPARTPDVLARDLSDQVRVLARDYAVVEHDAVNAEVGLAEVLIAPRSGLEGSTAFPGMETDSGDLVIAAIKRGGDELDGRVELQAGDVLLLKGRWDDLDVNLRDPDVVVVDEPDAVRRQAAPLGWRAWTALGILLGMVVLLSTGALPPAVTGLLAAAAMVLTNVVSVKRAHRSIVWTTLLLVAGMIPMSTAITQTGAAAAIASSLVQLVGNAGPTVALLALAVVAVIFGQLISNTATALIIAPIAVSVAASMHVSPTPFLMGMVVVCAAAYLTPVATPANLMVMGPSGLRFGDYWKFGLPYVLLSIAVGVFYVPLIWSF